MKNHLVIIYAIKNVFLNASALSLTRTIFVYVMVLLVICTEQFCPKNTPLIPTEVTEYLCYLENDTECW